MFQPIVRAVVWSTVIVCIAPMHVFAAGGTSIVATQGSPATVSPGWPAGVGELVNDAARTDGWNSWFTEWPNDVNQYGFVIATNDDLNRLIQKLASIKSDVRQIRLSHLKEPQALGWVTRLPADNKIAVVFSIGDQSRIDEWYKHVRKPFGQIKFLAVPVAVPPTLTIFVQNDAVNLDALHIPKGIELTSGYVPAVFHRSNTTVEKKQEAAAEKIKTTTNLVQDPLDPTARAAAGKIAAFLKKQSGGDGIAK